MAIRMGLPKSRRGRFGVLGVIAAIAALIASLAAGCTPAVISFEQALNGIKATMTTYNQYGQPVDEIHGESFRINRDTEFDTTNDKGDSNNDSKVLLISLGDHHIGHVGSTLVLAEDGLNDITAQIPPEFRFANNKPGTPWLNDLWYNLSRYWKGTAQTIMVRSQDGTPIKVYAGNNIQVLSTEVPSSTRFIIDGKTLFVYRADITRVDNALMPPPKK